MSLAATFAIASAVFISCPQASAAGPPAPTPTDPPLQPMPPEAVALMDRAYEAMGGKDAFAAVKSLHLRMATTTSQGTVTVDILNNDHGGKVIRQILPDQRVAVELGTNGTIAWRWDLNTRQFSLVPKPMLDSMPDGLRNLCDMLADLPRESKHGFDVHHKHPAEGHLCDVIVFKGEGDKSVELLFDSQSGLPVAQHDYSSVAQVPSSAITFGGWRQAGPILISTEREVHSRKETNHISFPIVRVDSLGEQDFQPPETACSALNDGPRP